MTIELKAVEEKAAELNYDLEAVKKEIKSVQSAKCRLGKQKSRKDYDAKMLEVLAKERLLVEVRQLLDPKEKPVTHYEQADVDMLDYDEVVKALRSIQSKKTLSKYISEEPGDNDEYRNACRIEEMLKERRDILQPVDNEHIRKTDLQTVIDTIEQTGNKTIKVETVLELLKNLM